MSKTIDISPQARKTVKELLQRYLPGATVWAYGSRVKWTARPDSDLDLVVFAGQELRSNVANLREAFDESNLPFRVDVLIWDEVPEKFREEIREGYVEVQGGMQKLVSDHGNSLPSSWKLCRLDEVSTIIDSLHKTPEYIPSGYPMVRVTDVKGGFLDLSNALSVTEEVFKEFTRRYTPKYGDIVFSRVGTYGNVSFVNVDISFCLGQNTALISPKISPRYLHLCLQSDTVRQQIEQTVAGSTQKTISLKSISALQIPIPPGVELEGITRLITTLDDKIELNRKMNQTLETMAQAIFKSWFVDFDPVKAKQVAKALGSNPERAAMAALSGKLCVPKNTADLSVEDMVKADAELDQLGEEERKQLKQTAALFPDGFVESELGLIPEGWEVGELREIAEIVMGQSPKGDTYNNQGVGTPLVNGPVEFGDYFPLSTKWTTSPTKMSEEEDLIVCVRGSTTGRFIKSDGQYCLGRGVCALRGIRSQSYTDFAYKYYLPLLLELTTGSTFPSWSGPTLKRFKIVISCPSVLLSFESTVSSIIRLQGELTHQSLSLAKLRDALLPKLLSGELRVDDVGDMS